MNLRADGFLYYPTPINITWNYKLREASLKAITMHEYIQDVNGIEGLKGVASNSLVSDETFLLFLQELFNIGLIQYLEKHFFESKCILNSFSSLNNKPKQVNFAGNVHRDIKFYTGEIPMMVNAILMLDDFTFQNGATKWLPGSHQRELQPSDGYFQQHSLSVTGKAGTIFLFNSNTWHCATRNETEKDRVAIAMTFSKSTIKQLMDYPRAIDQDQLEYLSDEVKGLLGFNARVPSSLNEFYNKNRMYKKGQD